MILLIDNYDSFTYNLYQYIGELYHDIQVVRNDEITIEQIEEMHPQALILSPGPGYPKDAGITMETIRHFNGKIPMLGVCLGHQSICEAFGGTIVRAAHLMHGKASQMVLDTTSPIFAGLPKMVSCGRYHSLIAQESDFPECLKVTARDENGQIYYRYQLGADESHLDKAGTVDLSPKDVLHIPALGFDGLVGYSPIAMARNSIGMAIACEDFGASFFRNGAAPSGVLEHPGVLKNPEKLRAAWEAQYGGSRNSGRVAVLEEGMKFNPIAIPPEQAQFLETRKFQVDEIARIFHVPPHMIGDLERSTFSNIEQQSLEFVKYTLNPWVCRWEQALTRSLLSPKEKREYSIRFNVDGLLRGDYQSRMNGYAVGRQNSWMSANDIRELENMDKISEEQGGDLYLVNGNMIKMTDAATNPREKDSA